MDVVVPFRGEREQLEAVRARLARLELRAGDSVLVVDNTPAAPPAPEGAVPVLRASERATPAYARNRGVARGQADWLVFIDADVDPPPDLLDRYFDPPPGERTGHMAGAIVDEPVPPGGPAAARYAYIRGFMSQEDTLRWGRWGFPKTANAAFRRAAFEQVGGFREELRAAEDADLTFRLREAGWEMERRERAVAVHLSRRTVRGFVRQKLLHGAGGAWLEREYPGASPPRRLPGLLWWGLRSATRRLAGAARARNRDEALWAVLEPLELISHELGRSLPNVRPRPPAPGRSVCAVAPRDGVLESQTRRPDRVARSLAAALAGDSAWLWLVDDDVVPEPDALERLLEALEQPLPRPILLASKVVTADGSLDPGSLPVAETLDPDLTVAAFERHLLSLRVARRGSLLVNRSAFERQAGSPDHDLEWTARLLRRDRGYLVPASVAVRRGGPGRQNLGGWLRLVLGDALERREKPWFAFRLAEQVLAALRQRP